MHSGRQWRNILRIYITSVWDISGPKATAEPNSACGMCQVFMKSKLAIKKTGL